VGDSEKKIAALLAATTAKKAFFENLKKKPAPPLEGALWLNSKPIQPEDVRGKPIQLHFWSIGCGPCLYELPRLEEMWGRSSRQRLADRPVFISIHPYVDGDELQELRDLLREKHITFPVMVDSRDPDAKAWGKTSAYYRVYSNPSDVWIDERGYVVRLDAEARGVGEGDWWMGSVDNKRPTSQIEKGR
jgi:thiol-disulfide isomerase/thioredoxin